MTAGQRGRSATWRGALGAALAVVGAVLPALGSPDAAGAQEPVSETITVTGRGWGHGRGLGQWGAFGYATGRSGGPWGYRTILDHFYSDTQVGAIGNPLAAVTLMGQRSKALVVQRAAGVTVDGAEGTSTAVRVTLRGDGRYDVQRAEGCAGPTWSTAVVRDGPVRIRAVGTTGERADALRICHEDGTSTGYRGELVAMARSFDGADVGLAQTVNLVRLDDLLRGVLPRLVPPGWAAIDDGRGRHALLAQAVASRGFAAVGDARWHDLHSGLGATFTTCDSSVCQPYGGVDAEDDRTDSVVRDTTGEVRVRSGVLVRTDYSASSGGWTAGVTFPPVPDVGDAVAGNPNRQWTELLGRDQIETRYGLGRLQAIEITKRNGLGEDGGRVLALRLVGTTATKELTGTEFRLAFGLRSDWFTVSGVPPRPPVTPRDVEQACPAASVPDAAYVDVAASSVHRLAISCVTWWEVAQGTGADRYRPAGQVTRAQIASFTARLLVAAGVPLPEDPPDAFTDDGGSVHERSIDQLAALEVVRGTSPGRYRPGTPITREQVASVIARALAVVPVALASEPADAFADDSGSVHELSINRLAAAGILTGASAGRLEPYDALRRDQMASLLARTLDLIVEETGTPLP